MIEYTRFVFCPRCGVAALEKHRKNAMRCTECGYVFFHNNAAAAAAIIEYDDGVVITVRGHDPHKGKFDLPGGFVDYNESLETALKREVREELGVDITIDRYLGSFPNRYEYKRVVYFTTDVVFVCRLSDPNATITANDEIERWEVVAKESIPFDRFAFASLANACGVYCTRESLH